MLKIKSAFDTFQDPFLTITISKLKTERYHLNLFFFSLVQNNSQFPTIEQNTRKNGR